MGELTVTAGKAICNFLTIRKVCFYEKQSFI